jgi:peptide/nickel transport system substrate-binding protein
MRRIGARGALVGGAALVAFALVAGAAAQTRTSGSSSIRNGGTLTIGLAEEPDVLDPTLARTFVGRMVFLHMCEKLYDLNAKLQIVPQLAAAMPSFSANKQTVTIRLRRGIRFNDGTPFNAAAGKQSLERHKNLKGSTRASELAPVTSIDAPNQYTVRLHLSTRYSPITAQLADRSGMIMSPKQLDALGDKFGTNPICVGPFMFKDRVAGDRITLTKSPYYYNKKNVHLSTLVFKIFNDPNARTQNLRSGDIQVEDRIQSTDIPAVSRDKRLRIIKATTIGYQGITVNIGNKNGLGKGYSNIGTEFARSSALRRAFSLALDRKAINKVVFGGTVQPDCFPFAPGSPWYAATKGYPCYKTAQVKAAQRLFASAHVQKPVEVKLVIGTDPVAARLGQVIQAMEAKVGFKVNLDPTEFTTALNREDAGKFELFAVGWSGRIDPDGNVYQFNHSKGSLNDSGYVDPIVDLTLDNARKAASMKARIVNYHKFLQHALRDLPIIYLYHPVNRTGVNKNVVGVRMWGDGLIRAMNAGYAR